jgi:hypothetical protein
LTYSAFPNPFLKIDKNSPMNTHVNHESPDTVSAQSNAGQDDVRDKEYLRNAAWEISERKPAEAFTPLVNHVALAMVNPCRGFTHWRISHE